MSSHKNRNRNKNKKPQEQQPAAVVQEKLAEQMNIDEEEPKDSGALLAEYEKQEEEAARRKAEREAARENAKKPRVTARAGEKPEVQDKSGKPDSASDPAEEKQASAPAKESESAEADVKQFVPHSAVASTAPLSGAVPTDDVNEAFAEEPEDMSEANEPEDGSAEAETAPARPNRFYLVFAVFVIIMSVIGVISTVNFCAAKISDIANRTELKNELTLFLYPVVSVDPPDCDTVDELPSTIIIESAIWRIILTGDNTNYEKLYNTYMYVPAIDVEFSVRSIYGPSVNIVHQTVGTMDMSFTYIPDVNSYLVPINPHYTAYSPRITELTNVGELYTVTVEYIPPSALAVEGIEFEVSATKTMVYTLSKSKNSATLHSIKNITRIENSYEF
jgi:hypothetical protein